MGGAGRIQTCFGLWLVGSTRVAPTRGLRCSPLKNHWLAGPGRFACWTLQATWAEVVAKNITEEEAKKRPWPAWQPTKAEQEARKGCAAQPLRQGTSGTLETGGGSEFCLAHCTPGRWLGFRVASRQW